MKSLRKNYHERLLAFPSLIWLLVFFLVPTLIVCGYALKPVDIYGGIGSGWSLETLEGLANPHYYTLIARTLWLSVATTLICLVLALPVGYQLATISKRLRQLLFLLIVIPFWSSFLIRIFAWKTLLHPEGALKSLLTWLHLVAPDATLLYNSGAVLLVMVYTYLPFAIFPIYASANKFNFQLMEAAMDLGATRWQAIIQVFIPGILKGIINAAIMVFIPSIGAYVIPDLVGGFNNEMIGNKIAEKIFLERNLPQASALSLLLGLVVAAAMWLIHRAAGLNLFDTQARNRE